MKSIKDIFNVDFSNYIKEVEELNDRIRKELGSDFQYALTEDKRVILYALIRYFNPDIVIETGVGPGASTAIILSALNRGVLYSIDPRQVLENNKPIGFLVPNNLRSRWKLYIGTSREMLPKILSEVGKVDVFLHDSEHTYENVMFELNEVWNYLRKGGLILIENFEWSEAPYHFTRQKGVNLYKLSDKAGGFAMIIKP